MPGYANGFRLTTHPARLSRPEKRKKPSFYFANSMSDLFHPGVDDAYLSTVFDVMRRTPQHTYMVLTKRAERLPAYFSRHLCPSNLWLGVTVENKRDGLPRVDFLRQVNARVRLLCMEPLLEDLGQVDLSGIHWIVVGGESGPRARPMREEWVENILSQAEAAHVPFCFRQWGEWGADGVRRDKRTNGRLFKGRIWDSAPLSEITYPANAGEDSRVVGMPIRSPSTQLTLDL